MLRASQSLAEGPSRANATLKVQKAATRHHAIEDETLVESGMIKKLEKKIHQIETLQKKLAAGTKLEHNQMAKLDQKQQLVDELSALKTAVA